MYEAITAKPTNKQNKIFNQLNFLLTIKIECNKKPSFHHHSQFKIPFIELCAVLLLVLRQTHLPSYV